MDYSLLLETLRKGDVRALAKAISVVENESSGYESILRSTNSLSSIPVIGITGPPGAGKSTLVNCLIKSYLSQNKKIGVIAVDPSSPFNFGSLLGDRIRMSEHFTNENVFIRSIATRGSLGGLSAKTIEICDVMKCFPFDIILVETVGVGQSEIEIVGLADTTILVLVPEAGDEIQGIKSGIMEIADIFVVNKADREGADTFANNLKKILHEKEAKEWNSPVLKTIASKNEGIAELIENIELHRPHRDKHKKELLLVEKVYRLIQQKRMKDIDKKSLQQEIEKGMNSDFNIYQLIEKYIS